MTVERPRIASGDAVNVTVVPQFIHVFDRKSGQRLDQSI